MNWLEFVYIEYCERRSLASGAAKEGGGGSTSKLGKEFFIIDLGY